MRARELTAGRLEVAAGAAAGLAAALVLLLVRLEPGGDATGLLDTSSNAADVVLQVVLGLLLGAALGRIAPDGGRNLAATMSVGTVVGLLWWLVGSLTLAELVAGHGPKWSVEAASAAFPSLIGDLFWGGLAGVFLHVAVLYAARHAIAAAPVAPIAPSRRVVILGGGFAGVAAAQRLERLATHDRHLEITLVSESNYLLFTPMLAEVASSALEAQHISAPVRASCPRTRFRRAGVGRIDLEGRLVRLEGAETLPFDHLVLALGAVPNYRGLPGMREHSFALKTLDDATSLRNHVLECLERADAEPDEAERRRLLTFVVVGGGFAGTELVAELFDLARLVLRYYPHVPEEELRFVLVHSRDRILPELGPELADYALGKLRTRGIEFVLETRVEGAAADRILLGGAAPIETRTIVWTAGNQPSPLLATLPCELDGGAVRVEATLAVPGWDGVWAVGDCARVPDPDTPGSFYPPTAQHALREGKVVAENVAAALRGKPPKPFRFRTIGLLVALGHRTAAAEIRGRRFSGLLAWFMWRGIYWSKLPGLEKKTRVLVDWTLDLVFPRDIVLTSRPTPTLVETIEPAQESGVA